jgi:hypothetical protein
MRISTLIDHGNGPVLTILLRLMAMGLKYLAYNLLTATVSATFVAMLMIYITIWGPELPFLESLSSLFQTDFSTFSGDQHDLMRIYSAVSLIHLALKESARAIAAKLWPRLRKGSDQWEMENRARSQKAGFAIITSVFVINALILPYVPVSNDTSSIAMYAVMFVIYLIAIITHAGYTTIDKTADQILVKLKSKTKVGHI